MSTLTTKSRGLGFQITLLAITGFLFKLYFIFAPRYISGDGAIYLCMAKALQGGDWQTGFGEYHHPMLSILTTLVSIIGIKPHVSVLLLNGLLASLILYPMSRLLRSINMPDALIIGVCALFMFYPRWFQFSTMPLSEVLFGTLLVFIADILRNELNTFQIVKLAVLTTAGYLTKTEGALLFIILPLLVLFSAYAFRPGFKAALMNLVLFIVMTALFSMPFLLHLKNVTGEWTLTAKTSYAVSTVSYENADIARFSVNSDGTLKPLSASHDAGIFSISDRIQRFVENMPYFVDRMPKTVVWPLFVLWVAGLAIFLFTSGRRVDPNPAFVGLWIFSVIYLLFYGFFYITYRYYVPYLPLAFIFASYAVFTFIDPSRMPHFDSLIFILACILIYFSIPLAEKERNRSAFSRMDAGAWAEANLNNEKIIALHGSDLSYYFNLKTSQLPYADADGLYNYAHLDSISYLLLGDFDIEDKDCKRPQLMNVFKGSDPRFTKVKEFSRSDTDKYAIFKIN